MSSNSNHRSHTILSGPKSGLFFILALILLLGAFFALELRHLLINSWSFDQGYYLLVARLIQHGYIPYSQIQMSEPPLMTWTIGWSLGFFQSVKGMQLVMTFYGLLAIAAVVGLGSLLENKLTGLLAGFLLAFNYTFFAVAHTVMPEVPSMALALVSLAAAWRYHHTGRFRWIILSAIAMAGSVLIKYFMPWLAPLLIILITLRPQTASLPLAWRGLWADWRRILQNWLGWAGIFWLVVIACWLAFDLAPLLDQTLLFHLLKSEGAESTRAQNPGMMLIVLGLTPVLTLCALAGLGRAVARFSPKGWILLSWAGLALLFLLVYSPLRSKHLIILAPLLAVLAAYALLGLVALWQTGKPRLRLAAIALAVAAALFLIPEFAGRFEALAAPIRPMIQPELQPLADLLNQFTSPADCLITDNPYLAFITNRMPPPWLGNLSYARFQSGSLTAPQMIEITNAYNCQVAAPILDRIKNSVRPYYDWTKNNYVRVWVVDGKEIMLGKPLDQAQPMLPLAANFNNQVELTGADWIPGEDGGYLSLYWLTRQKFTDGYKIFVQLRNSAGQTVVSADHEAYAGLIPTPIWPVDRIFKDTNKLIWPADLPPGSYTLYVGLYHPVTGERLPILADPSGENAVIIPGIEVN